jgi:hypothetical protein
MGQSGPEQHLADSGFGASAPRLPASAPRLRECQSHPDARPIAWSHEFEQTQAPHSSDSASRLCGQQTYLKDAYRSKLICWACRLHAAMVLGVGLAPELRCLIPSGISPVRAHGAPDHGVRRRVLHKNRNLNYLLEMACIIRVLCSVRTVKALFPARFEENSLFLEARGKLRSRRMVR